MQTEIEAKFLDVNPGGIREKLKSIGAKQIYPERLMTRKVFDFADHHLEKEGAWIRVRNEGDKVTLSYKKLVDRSLHGTKEITVVVDDFDQTCNLFLTLGFVQDSFQETKREKWEFENCEISLDTWPWIPTFVELEAPDENTIKSLAEKLGLDWNNALHGSVETAYQKYYNITEEEIDNWERITFEPVPDWLEVKRK